MKNSFLTTRYNFNFPLIIVTFLLVGIGIIFIYSAGSHNDSISIIHKHYVKQLLFLIPGAILFLFFLFFNYQKLSNYWVVLYLSAIGSLILVLIVGTEVNGTKGWFRLGDWISFQPSELAKLLFIFALARFLSKTSKSIEKLPFLLISLLIPLPIIGLVMFQPDYGTALIYILIIPVMLLIGGARVEHLAVILLIGIISLMLAFMPNYYIKQSEKLIQKDKIETMIKENIVYSYILSNEAIEKLKKPKLAVISNLSLSKSEFKKKIKTIKHHFVYFTLKVAVIFLVLAIIAYLLFNLLKIKILHYFMLIFIVLTLGFTLSVGGQLVLKPHHTTRISAFLDRSIDRQGINWNQSQSIIGIGAGGIIGQGLLNGTQNRLNYIPEKTTDFIFAVIGEEWGFIRGSLLILILFSILIYQGLMITYHSKDHFGTLVAAGITAMLFFHTFFNLGMCIGILPVMGLPLPFVSAGGSSLLTNLIGVAILLNISQRRFVH